MNSVKHSLRVAYLALYFAICTATAMGNSRMPPHACGNGLLGQEMILAVFSLPAIGSIGRDAWFIFSRRRNVRQRAVTLVLGIAGIGSFVASLWSSLAPGIDLVP